MSKAFEDKFASSWDEKAQQKQPKAPLSDQERAERLAIENQLIHLVNTSHSRPVHVSAIRIQGANRTQPSLIEHHIKPILDCATVGDAILTAQAACQQLSRLGIFEHVGLVIDSPQDVYAGTISGKESMDVIIEVKETNRVFAKTYADFQNDQARSGVSGKLRNPFGYGEIIEGFWQKNIDASLEKAPGDLLKDMTSSYQVEMSAPVNADPDTRTNVGLFNLNRSKELFSSHFENVTGAFARIKFLSPLGQHDLAYEGAIRHIHSLSDKASLNVRQDAGHSLKSGISHSVVRDTRDDVTIPTRGYFIRLYKELAGLGGDVKYVKGEIDAQYSIPIFSGLHMTATARGGVLQPLGGDRTRINDRFFLGGMTSVRGFTYNSIGPRAGNDNIGGDVFWSAGLSLISRLPGRLNYDPLRLHAFVNAGSASMLDKQASMASNIKTAFSAPTSSAGLGLIMQFSMVRLELNYCLPVTVTASDTFKKGWNWGIGLSFM
ncbi:hypothetical protein SmJEL517_g01061 [Synchytrium microbalum]|uniref:Bacterial surface antigen (D15) domain-containing protein n=1 Tax=Synchytrium microbalum TaxID=1806994 RepID=A0A507CBL2_9FUNG|nr:uncharacterized protein SmJEL517_g01061 [Synchytrium microbalum]TPX37012.1 hypothetical protein SmJEL517_g01061 [Synchytrium microbalum]